MRELGLPRVEGKLMTACIALLCSARVEKFGFIVA